MGGDEEPWLPAFGMVFLQTGMKVVVGEPVRWTLMRQNGTRLRKLLEVLDIVRCVSPSERSKISGALVLSLPK